MPSWKKVILSGSNAQLNQVTASDIKFTGTLYDGEAPFTADAEIAVVNNNDELQTSTLSSIKFTGVGVSLDTNPDDESSVTASFSGGGGGSGIFALTGSVYATTNELQISGSVYISESIYAKDTYFGDVNLSNTQKGPNEVDGTIGSWTIQEGEEDLFLINRKTGKKYSFMLKEVK
jgi:hypothetical protein